MMTETRVQRVPSPNDDGSFISSSVAVIGDLLITTQVPEYADGSMELGDAKAQSTLVFQNLKETLEANGSSLEEIAHLQIYFTDVEDRHAFNEVYREVFSKPFPVRCAVEVSAFTVAGMRVEVTAIAAKAK